jgi:hypothetical protein
MMEKIKCLFLEVKSTQKIVNIENTIKTGARTWYS